jgi:N-methylhydantoinase A/oxoprolinase/acetone carboxylase beta subunit
VRVRVRGEAAEAGETARRAPAPAVAPVRIRARRGTRFLRADLEAGQRIHGAARIEELSGTTWIPAGWAADVLVDGTLRLRRRGR